MNECMNERINECQDYVDCVSRSSLKSREIPAYNNITFVQLLYCVCQVLL